MEFAELKKHISNIDDYKQVLEETEKFLKEAGMKIPKEIEFTFWNHIGFLLQRMENDEQNSLDIPDEHGIDQESFDLTESLLVNVIKPKLKVETTDFEKFLIALYIQNIKKKKGGVHE